MTPRGKPCEGIIGIVEEGNHAMKELEGAVLDAALIAGAQKVEHYEIASYGTLAYFAELLGHQQAKRLLGETLEEEEAADEKLSEIAKSTVNREALLGPGTEGASSLGRGSRRAVSGVAHNRGARRTLRLGRPRRSRKR